jgi:hypothetical protein
VRIAVLVAILFLTGTVHAQESRMTMPEPNEAPLLTRLYLLNVEMRFDRDDKQEISNRYPFHLAVGFKKKSIAAVVEYSQFSEDSGNSSSSVTRTHREGVFWGRWHFKDFVGTEKDLSFYAAAGIGMFQDEVKTTLMGDSVTDTGEYKPLGALALGSEFTTLFKKHWGLVINGEMRALMASDFDPNINWSLLLGAGLQF